MKNFLQPANSSKILVFHNLFFFLKGFWQLYLNNINFLAKTKRCLYADFYEFKTKMTGKGKQNHIFQKSKFYEISSTVIYISKDQKLFTYFAGASHYTMKSILNVKKSSNLIKFISSHKICSEIKSQKVKKPFSLKNFWFFSKLLSSISSIYFRPSNFMCAFNR